MNKKIVLIIMCSLIVLYVFNIKSNQNIKEKLNNTSDNIMKIDQSICSKNCCNLNQWPMPKETKSSDLNDLQLSKYIGSNMFCNLGSSTGCLCLEKPQFDYLANRGTVPRNMCV